MTDRATVIADVTDVDIPHEGILSGTLFRDGPIRVVRFAFDEGQELTEHTATVPAIVQVVSGRLRVGAGGEEHVLEPGSWMHLPARMPHSVLAEAPSVLLLTMIRDGGGTT
ncbi:MAG TPA: cupin domain-containing protein [Acidimicrobiales bacterium]|nr:cupin domain-containing protein [Acidimicrobiales bacterium]